MSSTLARGTFTLVYLCAVDDVPESVRTHEHSGYSFRNDADAARHPRMRRCLIEFPRSTFFGALHWADGTDLDLLDLLADQGADIGSAVDRAVFGVFGSVTCLACHTPRRVLGLDGGIPEPTPAQRRRRWSTTCPTCGHDRYASHVEVLD